MTPPTAPKQQQETDTMADITIAEDELNAIRERAAAADSAAAAAAQAAADADAARAEVAAGVELFRTTIAGTVNVTPDLLPGATFADVQASADRARAIADAAVAAHTPATPAAPVVPAGGGNTRDDAPDTAGMSPHAKVRFGLDRAARK